MSTIEKQEAKDKMNIRLFLFLILFVFLVSGCAQQISDIKNEDYIGKTVVVKGTVENTIKLGSISGYNIRDESGERIGVSSKTLPAEGDTIKVKGVLIKDTLLGYYIKTE